jgi:hypothetical protein
MAGIQNPALRLMGSPASSIPAGICFRAGRSRAETGLRGVVTATGYRAPNAHIPMPSSPPFGIAVEVRAGWKPLEVFAVRSELPVQPYLTNQNR